MKIKLIDGEELSYSVLNVDRLGIGSVTSFTLYSTDLIRLLELSPTLIKLKLGYLNNKCKKLV